MKKTSKNGLVSYSEAFKKQVISEIERGKFQTPGEASRLYGITGGDTVKNWCLKYGRSELLSKRTRIETMKEIDEKKLLRQRIKELEAGLSDMTLNYLLEKNFLVAACEDFGVDVETVKKKSGFR